MTVTMGPPVEPQQEEHQFLPRYLHPLYSFQRPKELARYLLVVDGDHAHYLSYFRWQEIPQPPSFRWDLMFCEACWRLHHTVTSIASWFTWAGQPGASPASHFCCQEPRLPGTSPTGGGVGVVSHARNLTCRSHLPGTSPTGHLCCQESGLWELHLPGTSLAGTQGLGEGVSLAGDVGCWRPHPPRYALPGLSSLPLAMALLDLLVVITAAVTACGTGKKAILAPSSR